MNKRMILAVVVVLLVILGGTLSATGASSRAAPQLPAAVTIGQWTVIETAHSLLLTDDSEEVTYLPLILK